MKEEMIKVKCSICKKEMEMPKSFLENGIKPNEITHVCDECGSEGALGNEKMAGFFKDVNEQMEKMGENNELAEEMAEEITKKHSDEIIREVNEHKEATKEGIIREAFFRGAWYVLFLIGNNHEKGFLKKEAKKIKEFHDKIDKSEEK